MRKSRRSRIAWGLLALMLVGVNIQLATAHIWNLRSRWLNGTIAVYNTAVFQAEAEAALNDWDVNTRISLPRRTSHTDISVFDGNWGNTGWSGLASIESRVPFTFVTVCFGARPIGGTNPFPGFSCIAHAHARYNAFYGGTTGTGAGSDVRGIFCHEIGHTFNLDHSNTGDCMGKTYFNNINVTGPHNWADINGGQCCWRGP